MQTCLIIQYSVLICREYNEALRRLGVMSRGIGDPLVAIYARCYLCRVRFSHFAELCQVSFQHTRLGSFEIR